MVVAAMLRLGVGLDVVLTMSTPKSQDCCAREV